MSFNPKVLEVDMLPESLRPVRDYIGNITRQRMDGSLPHHTAPDNPFYNTVSPFSQLYEGDLARSYIQPLEQPSGMFQNVLGLLGSLLFQPNPGAATTPNPGYSPPQPWAPYPTAPYPSSPGGPTGAPAGPTGPRANTDNMLTEDMNAMNGNRASLNDIITSYVPGSTNLIPTEVYPLGKNLETSLMNSSTNNSSNSNNNNSVPNFVPNIGKSDHGPTIDGYTIGTGSGANVPAHGNNPPVVSVGNLTDDHFYAYMNSMDPVTAALEAATAGREVDWSKMPKLSETLGMYGQSFNPGQEQQFYDSIIARHSAHVKAQMDNLLRSQQQQNPAPYAPNFMPADLPAVTSGSRMMNSTNSEINPVGVLRTPNVK